MFQNFQFHFHYRVISKNILINTQSHNYASVHMVCWLSSVSSKLSTRVQIPPPQIFFPLFPKLFFHCKLMLEKLFTCFIRY